MTFHEALYKGLVAAGCKMQKPGGIFISVRDEDKTEIGEIAKKFAGMEFQVYATPGTADMIEECGIPVERRKRLHEDETGWISLLESGKVDYVISTSAKGRDPERESVKLRRKASQLGILCMTALDTANAVADSLMSPYTALNTDIIDMNHLRQSRKKNLLMNDVRIPYTMK